MQAGCEIFQPWISLSFTIACLLFLFIASSIIYLHIFVVHYAMRNDEMSTGI
ncbi:hypothetical protein CHCC20488_2780 [Bacillus paralicheniformis]|uniref:Uncharacterized protein n=1 Tax=Bacillus paralicheniformis TaxID=1648923 RepID=A0A7Z1B2W5_9BACI|nr:hypothetical protein SC10_B2orf03952 [Bacillus paralicheniformis]OLF90328.1 hypothetical protein B4121_3603 [Bacillus paralicheniformis]OLG08021.1 hypothetical protein B4125_2202 [Bacillus paralicheniformis]TWJ56755.1 hypothetical protein CHCC5022_2405 [Bacillus paralicheniformis]TWJ74840.1 hypothetical protein CHCC20497_3925 [Bacillus paralicheniformis]